MPSPSTLHLLVVDDDEPLRETLVSRFERRGAIVTAAGSAEEALDKAGKQRQDVALLDLQLPGMNGIELLGRLKETHPELEGVMLTAHSSIETAVLSMRQGAYDYLTKPFRLAELEVHVEKAFEKVQLARRETRWVEQVRDQSARYRLIGSSAAMLKVAALIQKIGPTDSTVLVRGESGTGKELVARAVHANSPRRKRPMVTINCAALQETLLESELFGHEKGAFTGAVHAKLGLVEVAEGGTLFIDEIGEMAGGLQAKLLRVLEDGHFRRVGATSESNADIRVVAATQRNLEEEIKNGRFREDLYYRLNVISIHLPPLREHRQDIPDLVDHFLTSRQIGPVRSRIDPPALEALMRHNWPGNIRELANVIERAQILAEAHLVTVDDLPDNLSTWNPTGDASTEEEAETGSLHQTQRRHILHVLSESRGNKVHAARALGISRRALYRLLDKFHLRDQVEPDHEPATQPS